METHELLAIFVLIVFLAIPIILAATAEDKNRSLMADPEASNCPHCGVAGKITEIATSEPRSLVRDPALAYQCLACNSVFTPADLLQKAAPKPQ